MEVELDELNVFFFFFFKNIPSKSSLDRSGEARCKEVSWKLWIRRQRLICGTRSEENAVLQLNDGQRRRCCRIHLALI